MHLALLEAAKALATPDRGATLRELAAHACVGFAVARYMVAGMARRGALVIVRTRRVPYRNRPVAEYALPIQSDEIEPLPSCTLAAAFSAWREPVVP